MINTYEINPTIFADGMKCGIVEFYERLAKIAEGKKFDHYDCTKIEVGEKIMDLIRAYYTEQGVDDFNFNMMWVCYGPKATLKGYTVQVEEGWAIND